MPVKGECGSKRSTCDGSGHCLEITRIQAVETFDWRKRRQSSKANQGAESAEYHAHGMLGPVIEDGNVLPGALDAIDVDALHPAAHSVRVLDDDVVRRS